MTDLQSLPFSLQELALYGVLLILGLRALPSASAHLSSISQLLWCQAADWGFGVSQPRHSQGRRSSFRAEAEAMANAAEASDEYAPTPSATTVEDLSQSGAIQDRLKNMKDLRSTSHAASQPGIAPPGLFNNGGNWCFLNSTLQALASLERFPAFLRSVIRLAASLDQSPPPLSSALLNLIQALNPSEPSRQTVLRPTSIAKALSSVESTSHMINFEQQDAQELFVLLLGACIEEFDKLDRIAKAQKLIIPGLESLLNASIPRQVRDAFQIFTGEQQMTILRTAQCT